MHHNLRVLRELAFVGICLVACAARASADRDGRTLIVGVDHEAYVARATYLLADEVREAASSRSDAIDIIGGPEGAIATIRDAAASQSFIRTIKKRYEGRGDISVTSEAAESFWIGYSAQARTAFGSENLRRDVNALEDSVRSLRSPLPGVTIERQVDGAIVRSSDPQFEGVLHSALDPIFLVRRTSPTSWHVSVKSDVWPKDHGPAGQLQRTLNLDIVLRQMLGDPVDLGVSREGDGIVFTISNPDSHNQFIESVTRAFTGNPEFVFRTAPAVVLKVARRGEIQQTPESPIPSTHGFELLDELNELANPSIEVATTGNSVTARAKDTSHNADRAEVIREAFATRKDVVITTLPDQSLSLKVAPDAVLAPSTSASRFSGAIEARARALKLGPIKISIADNRASVRFATRSDTAKFANAPNETGLTVRIVDENQSDVTKPPVEDAKARTASGEDMWLRPDVIVTSDMIADASIGKDFSGEPAVQILLTDEGRQHLAAATRVNVNRRLAVVQDGKVLIAPNVREPIEGGKFEISGGFTADSAAALTRSINAGKEELPLKVLSR